MESAVLLIAHGSRVDAANDDLARLAAVLAQRLPDEMIECAYLELAEPSIPQAMATCVERGARRVRMLPYFLSAGAHVSRDLESLRRQFRREYPQVHVSLCPPIGLHAGVVDALLERLRETDVDGTQPAESSE